MKLSLIFMLVFLAFVQDGFTQKAKLPAQYKPKGKEVVLSKSVRDGLTDFVVDLVRSSNIMGLSLPDCSFTTNVDGLFYQNRISSVARSLARVTWNVYFSAVIFYIDMMPLWVQGRVKQTNNNPIGPNYPPAVYQASASGISCVINFSRITKKVVYCSCRVNNASFDWFRLDLPLIKGASKNSTAAADVKKESLLNNNMINCIKKIINDGLCDYFKREINNRNEELEGIAS